MRNGILVLCACLLATPAWAATKLNIESTKVNGMEVRKLSCELENAGFMAMMQVMGALGPAKGSLDACAPAGAAFEVAWTWGPGKKITPRVTRSSLPAKDACVVKALGKAAAALQGRCTAIVLVGKPEAAAKAADALLAPPAAPAPAEPTPAPAGEAPVPADPPATP